MTLRSVLVSTDGPFTLSLLAFTVTLSLGRPHGSCKEARPEGLAGTESPHTRVLSPTHAQETKTTGGEEEGGEKRKGSEIGEEGAQSKSMTGLD